MADSQILHKLEMGLGPFLPRINYFFMPLKLIGQFERLRGTRSQFLIISSATPSFAYLFPAGFFEETNGHFPLDQCQFLPLRHP